MLCDFGLSCILHEVATHAQGSSTVTTLRIAAPELVNDTVETGMRSKASDVWAFGCTSGRVRLLKQLGPSIT